jgi:predicted PurR-regulated permease PerM
MTTETSQAMDTAIRIGLVALLALWCFHIASPFISPIVWAAIIAIAAYPVFVFLKRKTGLSDGWTSTLLTLTMLAILIMPTVELTKVLLENTSMLYEYLEKDELKIPPPNEGVGEWPIIGKDVEAFWQQLSTDHKAALGRIEPQLRKVASWLLSTLAVTGLSILLFIFSIILAGVFMASANSVKEAFEIVFTRLAGERGPELTNLSRDTVQSVVRGILGIALLQAVLAALGFMAMDIPATGLLALVCLVLAIVQIDILIVLIPLSIFVFSDPDTGTVTAIAFLIWNIAVGLLNNILKPILLAQGVEAPMAIIFIGAIGGMMLSGIIGLFVGAVVMVLGYTLFMSWIRQTIPNEKEIK